MKSVFAVFCAVFAVVLGAVVGGVLGGCAGKSGSDLSGGVFAGGSFAGGGFAGGAGTPSLRQMAQNLVVVGFDGVGGSDSQVKYLAQKLENGELGGVILFSRNVINATQTRKLNAIFKERGALVCIDEEGGRVTRFRAAGGAKSAKNGAKILPQNLTKNGAKNPTANGANSNLAKNSAKISPQIFTINSANSNLARSGGEFDANAAKNATIFAKISTQNGANLTKNPAQNPAANTKISTPTTRGAKPGFVLFASAKNVAATHSPDAARAYYDAMARQLAALNFNVNFAPVADLENPRSPIIAAKERAFAADERKVERYARAFIAAHAAHNVATALKHFAGHGSAATDTHKEAATATFNARETYPFAQLAQGAGAAEMVMASHVVFRGLDDDAPAVFSPKVLGFLRDELGFGGVVVSDDLLMGAVAGVPLGERVVRAVGAGVDLVIISALYEPNGTNKNVLEIAADAVVRAVERGELSAERVAQAYWRVQWLKNRLNAKINIK